MKTAKQRAIIEVIKFISIAISIGVGSALIFTYIHIDYICMGLSLLGLVFVTNLMYLAKLSQIETEDRIKEFDNKAKV